MKKIILFLLLLTNGVFAQDKNAAHLKNFDAFVQKVMGEWKVQGLSVAIIHKNKVILAKGYGYRDVEKKLPATAETLFAIGSCTKAFTAASVCMAAEDGKIDLDKPVREYLPDFRLYDDYATNNMTPRDLMCHRSGLPRHDLVWYGSEMSRSEIFSKLRYLEPNKPFRSVYQYQNLMFMTAGYLVERVYKATWENVVREKILLPLEMNSTIFSVSSMPKAKDYSLGYVERNAKVEYIPYANIDAMAPAGSINSNVNDMSHWMIALVNGGKYNGKQVLSPKTVRDVQTPNMFLPAVVPVQYDEGFYTLYGLAWTITAYRGHVRVDHGGNIDGFSASSCFLPKDSIAVVVLANMNNSPLPGIIRNNVIDRMLGMNEVDWSKRLMEDRNRNLANEEKTKAQEDLSRVKGTKSSHELTAYTGTFNHPAYGDIVISKDDSLSMEFHGMKLKLGHYHYDVFQVRGNRDLSGLKISFSTNGKGEIDKILVKMEPSVKEIEFERQFDKKLDKETLAKYAGQYDFGGAPAKVYIKGENTLILSVPGQPEYELESAKEHEFRIKNMKEFNIRFTVTEKNEVTELISIQPNGTFKARRK